MIWSKRDDSVMLKIVENIVSDSRTHISIYLLLSVCYMHLTDPITTLATII